MVVVVPGVVAFVGMVLSVVFAVQSYRSRDRQYEQEQRFWELVRRAAAASAEAMQAAADLEGIREREERMAVIRRQEFQEALDALGRGDR